MKFLYAFLFISIAVPSMAAAGYGSSAYECSFKNSLNRAQSIRIKDYFDTQKGQRVGNVDLLENSTLIERTPVLIYQIPFWDQDFYVQIWYASDVWVDAQLSLSGPNQKFFATYHKGALREELFCLTIFN